MVQGLGGFGRTTYDGAFPSWSFDFHQGKRCMDIGCNVGYLTTQVSLKYGVQSMVGIDLDEKLIFKVCFLCFFIP